LAALPAAAQDPPRPKPPLDEFPKLEITHPEAAASPSPGFFTPAQLATLRRLSSLVMPPAGNRPGALEAGTPEFLDFLLRESPAGRQGLYRRGLDRLENEARHNFGKAFDGLSETEAATLLAPLLTAPTAAEPSRFLHAAKDDILRASMNSRQYAAASGQRRAGGVGTYWLPIE
jgi:hypothetical protein